MGRELKRVPLNFDAPLRTIWRGYINPFSEYSKNCPFCDGSGESPRTKHLSALWYGNAPFVPEDNGSTPYIYYHPAVRNHAVKNVLMSEFSGPGREGLTQGSEAYWKLWQEGGVDAYVAEHLVGGLEYDIEREGRRLACLFNSDWCHHLNQADVDALLKDDRMFDLTHHSLNEEQKVEYDAIEAWNTAERSRATTAGRPGKRDWKTFNNGHVPTPQEVNDWSISGFGHDSINMWVCVRARMKREKLGTTKCAHCKGKGTLWLTTAYESKCEGWMPKQPPTGKGFQLWGTTGEGEPISPVFKTLDALAEWCEVNATAFADCRATKQEWVDMLDAGFVCHKSGNNIFI